MKNTIYIYYIILYDSTALQVTYNIIACRYMVNNIITLKYILVHIILKLGKYAFYFLKKKMCKCLISYIGRNRCTKSLDVNYNERLTIRCLRTAKNANALAKCFEKTIHHIGICTYTISCN